MVEVQKNLSSLWGFTDVSIHRVKSPKLRFFCTNVPAADIRARAPIRAGNTLFRPRERQRAQVGGTGLQFECPQRIVRQSAHRGRSYQHRKIGALLHFAQQHSAARGEGEYFYIRYLPRRIHRRYAERGTHHRASDAGHCVAFCFCRCF